MLVDIGLLNLNLFVLVIFLTFMVSFFVYYRYLWNYLDPMLMLLFSVSINAGIVFYFYMVGEVQDIVFIMVLASFISFLLGLIIASRFSKALFKSKEKIIIGPSRQFSIYLLFSAIFFKVIYLLFLFNKAGFGLITGDIHPDIKLMIFLDGGGIFKYFDVAANSLLVPILFYIYFIIKNKYYFYIGLFFLIFYNIMFPTSKAGMVMLVFQFGMLVFYLKYVLGQSSNSGIIAVSIILVGVIPAIIVLSRYSTDILAFLFVRVVDTGGGSYSYFVKNGYKIFEDYSFSDNVKNYFDTCLSVFRIKPWEDPNRMAAIREYLTGGYQHGYGQNPFLFLDGHFLLGGFGFIYTFFVGIMLGFIRFAKIDFISFNLFGFLLISLVSDPDVAQARLVSFILILIAIFFFVIVRLFLKNKISLPVMAVTTPKVRAV